MVDDDRPNTWFLQHRRLFGPGVRVLDLACGRGRHAVAAARAGAQVVGIDRSVPRLEEARQRAREAGVAVEFRLADLETIELSPAAYDLVMVFNYLDRSRMSSFGRAVHPGGYLLLDTFHAAQRLFPHGPRSPAHLLEPGEILTLTPVGFERIATREVYETIDAVTSARAGLLARRSAQS